MQTVKFQCGKCQKVMAVGDNLLGKQVRCPHCQQVILAPATVPAPVPVPALAPAGAPTPGGAPEVVFRMPVQRTEEEGSIFGENEEEGDDLFNSPRAPTVELPPAPPPLAALNTPAAVATTPMPALAASHPSNGTAAAEGPIEGQTEADSPAVRARQLARMQSQRESKMTFLLLIVIVPYALIMTIAVIFLVLTRPDPKKNNEFPKLLPDGGEGGSNIKKRAEDMRPLSDEVKVALGAETPLKINQLEITPLKVAWKRVAYAPENGALAAATLRGARAGDHAKGQEHVRFGLLRSQRPVLQSLLRQQHLEQAVHVRGNPRQGDGGTFLRRADEVAGKGK